MNRFWSDFIYILVVIGSGWNWIMGQFYLYSTECWPMIIVVPRSGFLGDKLVPFRVFKRPFYISKGHHGMKYMQWGRILWGTWTPCAMLKGPSITLGRQMAPYRHNTAWLISELCFRLISSNKKILIKFYIHVLIETG